ncbi:MAG: hypothetical protein KTR30_28265 [Saprospiraceae bacterium]|nr:hypothetical protein [Saprospiraceae bacterium]
MKKSIQLFLLVPLFVLSACQSNEEAVSVAREAPVFIDEADALHYVLLKVKSISAKLEGEEQAASNEQLTQLKEELNALVKEEAEAKLRVSMIYFESEAGLKDPILVVRRFENLDQAKVYSKILEEKLATRVEIESILPIAQTNYRMVLKEKSLVGYQTYFKKQFSSLIELDPAK